MDYINKTTPPKELKGWIKDQKKANIIPVFGDFRGQEKDALKKQLIEEQKYLCCYCQQEIFLDLKIIVEHFLPQSKFKNHQLDYYNLHLACAYSAKEGLQINRHCDVIKGDELIINIMQHPNCNEFFKFNRMGEILPNNSLYKTIDDFNLNISKLGLKWVSILHLINLLNLNSPDLVNKRKKTIEDILPFISKMTKTDVTNYINRIFNQSDKFPRFKALIEYYLGLQNNKLKN